MPENKSDIATKIYINFTNVAVYVLHVTTYQNQLEHKLPGAILYELITLD